MNSAVSLKENEVRESLKSSDESAGLKRDLAIAKRAIAKVSGLGYSNSEAEAKSLKELEVEAEAKVHELTDLAKKATDETLKAELVKTKNSYLELQQKIEKDKEDWTKTLTEKEQTFQSELKAKDHNIWLKEKFNDPKTKLRDPAFKRIIEQDVLSDIKDFVKGDDGSLKTKDGLHATIMVEGKAVIVANEDEVFEYRYKPYAPVDNQGGGNNNNNQNQNNNNQNNNGQQLDHRLAEQERRNQELLATLQ